jgi:ATP-dependent protease HslVU (ClpYQ) peptidase subunit
MTLGIAAICENGKAAAIAADRMVSTGIAGLEIEPDVRKLTRLDATAMVATTGTISDARYALEIFHGLVRQQGEVSATQYAEYLRSACETLRLRRLEILIVRRHLLKAARQLTSTEGCQRQCLYAT